MTGARVFIHPRCLAGPALGALTAMLEERGLCAPNVCIITPDDTKRAELVRPVNGTPDTAFMFERRNGERFNYRVENHRPIPPTEAA